MEMKDLARDAIYVGDGDFADIPGYLYIRGLIDGRIGFSVLYDPLEFPDFTDCGVFWVPPEFFVKSVKIYKGAGTVKMPKLEGFEYC